jgi:hypothetical protein
VLHLSEILAEATTSGEFTDCISLIKARREAYSFYLDVVSSGIPSLAGLEEIASGMPEDTLNQIYDSPIFRAAINRLYNSCRQQSEPCANAIQTVAEIVGAGDPYTGSHPLLGTANHDGRCFVDTSERQTPAFGLIARLFDEQVARHFVEDDLELCSPDKATSDAIAAGLHLLKTLVPELAATAMAHVYAFALAGRPSQSFVSSDDDKANFQAASSLDVPGCVFLTSTIKSSVWRAAETVFHEAIHQKMFDLMATREIYRVGYAGQSAERVPVPWNAEPDGSVKFWTTDRALFACHVYVYLQVYYLALCDRLKRGDTRIFGSMNVEAALGQSTTRSAHLLAALAGPCQGDLGKAGKRFFAWLRDLHAAARRFAEGGDAATAGP